MKGNFIYFVFLTVAASCNLTPAYSQQQPKGSALTKNDTSVPQDSTQTLKDLIIEYELTSEGDTIYHYKQKVFDFGEIINRLSPGDTKKNTHKTQSIGDIQMLSGKPNSNFFIDTKKSVGQIPFTESVSPSGSRTYSIPIATVSSYTLIPQLSISYNSQSSNAVAGYGWSLAGISVISVTGKTIYYDGITEAIDRSKPDECVFTLDGVRLVQNTETLANEYQYETAQGFILARKHYNGTNIAFFTVAYPNGSTATFGFKHNTDTKLAYPITELTDVKGNTIHYEYIESGNTYYLSKVSYGGKNLTSCLAEISFEYEERTDFTTAYIDNSPISVELLLKRIVSRNMMNGTMQELCTYTLTHELKDFNRLTQIDCSSGNSSLNPLRFEYDYYQYEKPISFHNENNLLLSQYFSSLCDVKRGKFVKNEFGDGLITYPSHFKTYTKIAEKVKKKFLGHTRYFPIYGSDFPADQDLLIAPGLTFFCETKTIKAENGFQLIDAVDIDGDGIDNIVKINFGDLVEDNTMLKITTYQQSGKEFSPNTFTIPVKGVVNCKGETYSPMSRVYLFGDFKGTGKTQLLTISHNKTFMDEYVTSYFALIDLEDQSKLSETPLFSADYNSRIYPLDTDGDGKTELCHVTNTGMDVYGLSNNNCFTKLYKIPSINKDSIRTDVTFGDLNGDGKIDMLVPPEASYEKFWTQTMPVWVPHRCPECNGSEPIDFSYPAGILKCRYCGINIEGYYKKTRTGTCRVCSSPLVLERDTESPEYKEVLSCPIHGISCGEKVVYEILNYGNIWTAYLSTGRDFVKTIMPITDLKFKDQSFLMDANGDGNADLFFQRGQQLYLYLNKNGIIQPLAVDSIFISEDTKITPANVCNYYCMSHFITVKMGEVKCYNFTKDCSKEYLLTTLIDSYGNRHTNRYEDMTSPYNNCYHPTTGTYFSYPYFLFIAPWKLLSASTVYTSDHKLYKQNNYSYYGAVMHHTGLGFSGFERVITRDELDRSSTTETHDPKLFGVTTRVDTPNKETVYSYSLGLFHKKKHNLWISAIEETDKLTDVCVSTNYDYNPSDYNYPITTTITYGTYDLQTIKEQTYSHLVNSSCYLIGRPQETTTTTYRIDDSWITKEVMEYGKGYLPKSQNTYIGNNKTSETHWEYDVNGNLSSEKSAPYNVTEFLGDTYTYDTNGRYVVTKTNALGQTTTYSNYDKWGHARTITDFKNNITTIVTDAWGNTVSTISPDSVTETITTAWGGKGLYTITKTVIGKPTTIVHYDAVGREVRTGVQRFDGQWQFVDKVYDSQGRLEKESLPFRGDAPTYWNTYAYDQYNRPVKLTEASGKTTTWSYQGRSVKETKNGFTISKLHDEIGALIKVEDPGGCITYDLRPDGQPTKITAPNNIVTSFEYDEYGRRTAINDPSAGRQTFTENYNADGTCISNVTDAKGRTITTTTDKYGRVTNVNKPEFSTTYTYNEDGQVEREIDSNGGFKAFEYDKHGRMVYSIEGENDLETEITYNQGNISSVKYRPLSNPFGDEFIRNVYENYVYKNGYKTEIKVNDDKSIWKLVEENDLGQPTKVVTGPLERTYSYTVFGLPTRRTVGNIQDFSYSFDIYTGNLLSRTDNTRHITETFKYDQLNRLNQIGTQQVEYTDNGNIVRMPDVGKMTYGNTSKPYQVTSLTPMGIAVPVRDQQITYTSFQRPDSIMENGYTAFFSYDAEGERTKMTLKKGTDYIFTKYYVGAKYEIDYNWIERLYLGGDAYNAPAVCINNCGDLFIYYIARDYLGSITHITDDKGTLVQELSYDAWGRLRNPDTQEVYAPGKEPELFLGRGYTGHEHLPWFGLINMNARLYDPALGRFLSPDPYVQMPDFTQSFNRYSYCLSNPLKYVDKNGEFFWLIPVIAAGLFAIGNTAVHAIRRDIHSFWDGLKYFTQGAITGAAIGYAWHLSSLIPLVGKTIHAGITAYAKLQAGMGALGTVTGVFNGGWKGMAQGAELFLGNFYLDEHSFWGGIWHGFIRHTWEAFQNLVGQATSQFLNTTGITDEVQYWGGAIFSTTRNRHIAVSIGSYINVRTDPYDNFDKYILQNSTVMHEYGHTFDSRLFGLLYLPVIGSQSLLSASKHEKYHKDGYYTSTHAIKWYERSASRHAKRFFSKYGVIWDEREYPTYY